MIVSGIRIVIVMFELLLIIFNPAIVNRSWNV